MNNMTPVILSSIWKFQESPQRPSNTENHWSLQSHGGLSFENSAFLHCIAQGIQTCPTHRHLACAKQTSSFQSMRVAYLDHSSNPVCGFSMMELVRLCTVWPQENWLGTSKTTYRVGWMIWICYSRALERRCLLKLRFAAIAYGARRPCYASWTRNILKPLIKNRILESRNPFSNHLCNVLIFLKS